MQERQKELERFKRDTQYYEVHWDELLERYPEQWVSIFNEQVVAASPNLDEVLSQKKAKGVPAGHGLVEYVTTKEDVLILPL